MASNPATEIASTIQAGHIEPNPDPRYDLNPSTAASRAEPVRLRSHPYTSIFPPPPAASSSDTVPISLLSQPQRQHNLPPLPDLRFEQSYLASISRTTTTWGVAWVTARDQILMPLLQGVGWNLVLHGWKAWNVAARFQGQDADQDRTLMHMQALPLLLTHAASSTLRVAYIPAHHRFWTFDSLSLAIKAATLMHPFSSSIYVRGRQTTYQVAADFEWRWTTGDLVVTREVRKGEDVSGCIQRCAEAFEREGFNASAYIVLRSWDFEDAAEAGEQVPAGETD